MITIVLFLIVIILVTVEGISVWGNKRELRVEFDVDTTLVEPGEPATLYYTVRNPYRLPVLFVGFSLYLKDDVTVCEDKEFCRVHVSVNDTGTSVLHHFYLPPHSKFSGKVHISLSKRGLHDLGKYFLETGDFLGLFPIMTHGTIYKRIVCTSEKCAVGEVGFPGGELGEISVRRFIMDDPTILLGYREYTGREPMKQISWKQTAKTGTLMVRQNDYTSDRVATVLVNMYSSLRPQLEECLKLVRTVCEQLEEAKIPYELMSNGDLLSVPEGMGKEHLFFILRRLGLSRLAGFNGFGSLIDRCIRRRRGNSCYVVITPAAGPEVSALIDYLGAHVDSRPIVMVPGETEAAL
ncbi:MAG: DUF58 domain-containing protein [Lachnospiraceae bacterium]|nr:DUF58 domain-containing protein [Lachnospiraceae bacterium]